jgi:hypothetical protein
MNTLVVRVTKWALCALGGLTGLCFAVHLCDRWDPIPNYVGATYDEFTFNFFNGRLHLGEYFIGLLVGAILGYSTGERVARFSSNAAAVSLLAAGGFLWLLLWTIVGVAVGGWLARSGATNALDAVIREYYHKLWGALLGPVVGYCLFLVVCGLLSSRAALASENERLRGEVARLRQDRP